MEMNILKLEEHLENEKERTQHVFSEKNKI